MMADIHTSKQRWGSIEQYSSNRLRNWHFLWTMQYVISNYSTALHKVVCSGTKRAYSITPKARKRSPKIMIFASCIRRFQHCQNKRAPLLQPITHTFKSITHSPNVGNWSFSRMESIFAKWCEHFMIYTEWKEIHDGQQISHIDCRRLELKCLCLS